MRNSLFTGKSTRVAGRFTGAVLAALAVGVLSGQREAGAQVTEGPFSVTYGYALTDFTQGLVLPKFDPNQGYQNFPQRQLVSVQISLVANVRSQITVTNNSTNSASQGDVSTRFRVGLTDPAGVFASPPFSGTSPTLGSYTLTAFTDSFSYSLAPGGTISTPDRTGPGALTGSANRSDTFKIAGYGGAGTVNDAFVNQFIKTSPGDNNITFNATTVTSTVLANTGGNTDSTQTTDAQIQLQVIYTFQPVPAPPSVIALGIGSTVGMVQFGTAHIRRRRKPSRKQEPENEPAGEA
jgi:hypothetical protein